jgi:CheY-like chemotaxis protein
MRAPAESAHRAHRAHCTLVLRFIRHAFFSLYITWTRSIISARDSFSSTRALNGFSRGQVVRPPAFFPAVSNLTARRVLIVEDDDAIRQLWERVLGGEGWHVRSVADGREALRSVNEQTPDLIVLDLMLPWVNGIEVLATVRRDPGLTKIPVVVTTGTATSAFDLRDFGPVRVLRKPFSVSALISTVRRLLDVGGHTDDADS